MAAHPGRAPVYVQPDIRQAQLALVRDLIEQEFRIAERLDSKARGQLSAVLAWFTVAQALTGVAASTSNISSIGKAVLLGFAVLSSVCVVAAFLLTNKMSRIRKEGELGELHIRGIARAAENGKDAIALAIDSCLEVLERRRTNNSVRADRYRDSSLACVVTALVILAEVLATTVVMLYA